MTSNPGPTSTRTPLSADSAFVVHLSAADKEAPEAVSGRIEHITSGKSARFATVAELLGFMRTIATTIVLLSAALPGPAWGDATCLTGSDPMVEQDAVQIAALRVVVDTACPCASFEKRPQYLRCVSAQLGAAVRSGDLRKKCKARVQRAFRESICGRKPELQAVPCIAKSRGGPIRCAIRAADACQSKPGRYERVACPDYVNCVEAGDDNGDYLVDRFDSGLCIDTPGPTPTSTPTSIPTTTPADTDTPTPSPTATPTATPTAAPTATPTTAPTDTPSATPTSAPTVAPTSTPTACSGSGPIIASVVVNKDDDPQVVVLPPAPAANQCDPQTLLGGGCEINGLDGTIPNTFDASASSDTARCPGDPPLSFYWQIMRPPGLGGTPYSAAGISGYHGPVLTILPNSFPSLEDSEAAGDPNWRVLLTIQSNVFPFQVNQKWFKFEYTSSSLTLQMSTDCQRIGHIQGEECTIEASNGLPATDVAQPEPGWTICANEGGTCSFSGPRTVRFGVHGDQIRHYTDGPISCTHTAFGAAPGAGRHCEYYGEP